MSMDETQNQGEPHPPAPGTMPRRRLSTLAIVIFVVVVALILVAGILPRLHTRAQVRSETAQVSVPYVAVVQPTRQSSSDEIVLPANIQAFTDSPIYARTDGYLKKWYFDIGAHVKEGQLLAEIETPEIHGRSLGRIAEIRRRVAAGSGSECFRLQSAPGRFAGSKGER